MPGFIPGSFRYTYRLHLKFFIPSAVLFYIFVYYNSQGNICHLCRTVSEFMVFGHELASTTPWPDAFRVQFIFILLAAPYLLIKLYFNLVPEPRNEYKFKAVIASIVVLCLILYLFVFLNDATSDIAEGGFTRFWLRIWLLAPFINFCFLFAWTFSLLYIFNYFKYLFVRTSKE